MDIEIKSVKILYNFSVFIGAILLLILIISALYFFPRGFDLSDESFYLYSSIHTLKEGFITTNFGILNHFFLLDSPGLIGLRVLKLLLQLASSVAFFFGLRNYLRYNGIVLSRNIELGSLLLVSLSSFINYDYLPMSMSYNSWSLVLALSAMSLLLTDFTKRENAYILFSSVLYGFICFAAFLAKFPNFFFFGFIYFLTHVFVIKNRVGFRLLFVLIGLLLGYFIFIHDYKLLELICSNYYDTIFGIKHLEAHSYANDFRDLWNVRGVKVSAGLQILTFVGALLLRKLIPSYKLRDFIFYALITLNFSTLFYYRSGNSQVLCNDFIIEMIFLFNAVHFFIYSTAISPSEKTLSHPIFVIVVLMFMPFVCSIGSNNPFYYSCSHYFIFLIGAVLILVLRRKRQPFIFLMLNVVALCFVLPAVLLQGAVKTPYRQSSLLNKTYPLKYPVVKGVYESYEALVDYASIETVVTNIDKDVKRVFCTANYIGTVFFTGAELYPPTWISDSPDHIPSTEFILKKENFSPKAGILLLPIRVARHGAFIKLFSNFNVNLTANYRLAYTYKCISIPDTISFYILLK